MAAWKICLYSLYGWPVSSLREFLVRRGWKVLASVVLALLVLAGLLSLLQGQSPKKAYAVSAVLAGLRRHPRHWVGRTVLVRGRLVVNVCYAQTDCPYRPQALIDTRVPAQSVWFSYPVAQSLPVMSWSLDVRQQFLRAVPLGDMLAEQLFQSYTREGVIGTYRVRLYHVPSQYAGVSEPYAAAVLDGLG